MIRNVDNDTGQLEFSSVAIRGQMYNHFENSLHFLINVSVH